jgi:HEAT repeat protein
MRPRYADLFRRMLDPEQELADAAYDAVLFERADAVPDLVACYEACAAPPARGLARRHDQCTTLRFLSVQLLGFSEAPAALPTILAALDDRSPLVRAEACRSLEDLRHAEALPLLEARLADVDAAVCAAAAEAVLALRPEHAAALAYLSAHHPEALASLRAGHPEAP